MHRTRMTSGRGKITVIESNFAPMKQIMFRATDAVSKG